MTTEPEPFDLPDCPDLKRVRVVQLGRNRANGLAETIDEVDIGIKVLYVELEDDQGNVFRTRSFVGFTVSGRADEATTPEITFPFIGRFEIGYLTKRGVEGVRSVPDPLATFPVGELVGADTVVPVVAEDGGEVTDVDNA